LSDRTYCIDTSTVIHLMRDQPPEFFPGLWARIDGLIEERRFLVHRQVYEEIVAKGDGRSLEWKKKLPRHCIVEIDNAQGAFITRMGAEHRYLKDLYEQPAYQNKADPFLIALGYTRGCHVVTEESKTKEWRIPDVCQQYGIECVDRWGMMRLEGWTF
jgi:hypothetical protein